MQKPQQKYPLKQLSKLPLFRTIKQINGQKIFNQLHESCQVLTYQTRTIDKDLNIKESFIYVKEGQVFVYKVSKGVNGVNGVRSLIKSYRAEEYCGFHDYPLFWGEGLLAEANSNTTIILVPIKYFYKFFRRVIPMTYLQSKAQYLKKLPQFRKTELQTIFKLACISQKYRVVKQQLIIKQGELIDNIYVICSGKFQLRSNKINQTIVCGPNQGMLMKQFVQNIPVSCFQARCTQQADVLAIPVNQYKKLTATSYKLEQPWGSLQSPYQTSYHDKHKTQQDDTSDKQSISQYSAHKRLRNIRIKSAKIKTEGLDYTQLKDKPSRNMYSRQKSQQSEIQTAFKSSSGFAYSLGQIQLLKFIKRKQKIENRNFFKYIQSRAPEIVINPSKQFALVKPFYSTKSQYVRNMKRKIKHSVSIGHNSQMNGQFNDFLL